MKITKANKRDQKRHKAQYGMCVDGRSTKLIAEILANKANKAIKAQEKKVKNG